MCSIEEAWAGQNFDGKKVVSQGDFHNNYMSLPVNILNRNNELSIKKTNQEPVKNLPRGVNSKYSREPRVPKIVRNASSADINISSEMPEINNYGGLEPLPSFMSIYNNNNNNNQSNSNYSYPMPITTGEHFTDIENAYKVSDTLSKYMNTDTSNKYMNTDTSNKYMNTDTSNKYMNTDTSNKYMNTETNLLNEDTEEESHIINNKFTNMNRNTNSFKNYNNNNNDNNNNNNNNDNYNSLINDSEIKLLLNTIIKKIDNIEIQLSNYNNKNIYDLILYIIIGILLSFCIYSIFSKKK